MKWKDHIPRMGTYLGLTSGRVPPRSPVQSCQLREWYERWTKTHGGHDRSTRGGHPPLRVYSRTRCSLAPITAQQDVTSPSSRSGQPALFHLGETVWPNFGKRMGFMWNQRLKMLYVMEYNSAMRRNEMIPIVATWMQREMATLSEGSHRKTNIIWCHSRGI